MEQAIEGRGDVRMYSETRSEFYFTGRIWSNARGRFSVSTLSDACALSWEYGGSDHGLIRMWHAPTAACHDGCGCA